MDILVSLSYKTARYRYRSYLADHFVRNSFLTKFRGLPQSYLAGILEKDYEEAISYLTTNNSEADPLIVRIQTHEVSAALFKQRKDSY